MWHLLQTQGKQNLNCGQSSSTPPVNTQVGVLQQTTTRAGSPRKKDQCKVGWGAVEQTRVQRLRLGSALGCWESGVESDPTLGEKDRCLSQETAASVSRRGTRGKDSTPSGLHGGTGRRRDANIGAARRINAATHPATAA